MLYNIKQWENVLNSFEIVKYVLTNRVSIKVMEYYRKDYLKNKKIYTLVTEYHIFNIILIGY